MCWDSGWKRRRKHPHPCTFCADVPSLTSFEILYLGKRPMKLAYFNQFPRSQRKTPVPSFTHRRLSGTRANGPCPKGSNYRQECLSGQFRYCKFHSAESNKHLRNRRNIWSAFEISTHPLSSVIVHTHYLGRLLCAVRPASKASFPSCYVLTTRGPYRRETDI